MKTNCPVCEGRGDPANQCSTDSKALAVPGFNISRRDYEEMDFGGMSSVRGASRTSLEVAENSSKGTSESGSCVCDVIVGCSAMPPIDYALLADDADDAYL